MMNLFFYGHKEAQKARRVHRISLCAVLWLLTIPSYSAIPVISPELGKTLEQVQVAMGAKQWDDAVTALKKFKGEKNALWYNALGQIYLAQEKLPEAEEALREAYTRNSDKQFGLALAVCLMEQDKNDEALLLFGKHIDFSSCDQSALESYLSLAAQKGDSRLVQEITRWGLMRFPDSRYLREMDLQLAVKAGDDVALVRATDALLLKEPLDPRWWQSRAAGADEQSSLQLARLEAAALANPENMGARSRHMSAQLAAGHFGEALAQAGVLMQNNPDSKTMLYCVQAAVMMQDFDIASKWMQQIEPLDDENYWRVLVVVSIQNKGLEKADEALAQMLKFPDPNASLWRWAARAAVDAESPLAEKWLMQGLNLDPDYQTAIALDYAHWLISEARMQEAAAAINAYIAQHPADSTALALLRLTSE